MTAVEPRLDGTGSRWLCLQRAGVMVVLDVGGPFLPWVVYWGGDLGATV